VNVDYLIVGSGLTGAVIARSLADAGRGVVVVDRRSHIGGNVHDHAHCSGIRIHTYGPHYFRTSCDRIWEWATRFGEFFTYEAAVLSDVEGSLVPWPLSADYISSLVGESWIPEFVGTPANLEQAALSLMPRRVYELFVREYNEKQWGVPCVELSADLCRRFDVRPAGACDQRLTPMAKHQGIPVNGYAEWTRRMFDGIPVILNYDFVLRRDEIKPRKHLVFTGPIDEFFGYEYGRLGYRGQRRHHVYHPHANYVQRRGQINNPTHAGGPHIRTLEWKHMMQPDVANRITGSVVTTETPFSPTVPSEYEYPFPDAGNAATYAAYRRRADAYPETTITGRLGEYKYLDMDQAIARAMKTASVITGSRNKAA
jgi:UDP-galactopyranose mutase